MFGYKSQRNLSNGYKVVPDSLAQTSFTDWLQEDSNRLTGLKGMLGLQMSRLSGQTQAQQDFLNAIDGLEPEYNAYAPFAYDAITAVGLALNTALQNSQDPENGEEVRDLPTFNVINYSLCKLYWKHLSLV